MFASNFDRFRIFGLLLAVLVVVPTTAWPRQNSSPSKRLHHHGGHNNNDGSMEVAKQPEVISCSERNQPVYEGNPQDCSSYYVCSGMFYLLFRCPESLHYNTRTSQCDYPASARCTEQSSHIQKSSFDY